nr:protein transport protein Sec24-like At3g07100 [Ipomoea batatas]
MEDRGLYIYDDGFRFVIWFGRMLSPDIIKTLMGDDFTADFSKVCIREQDNEMSRKLMGLLRKYHQSDQSYYQLCHLVRQGEQPREGFFLLSHLVEDQTGGSNGYMDWIVQLHRQVQQSA